MAVRTTNGVMIFSDRQRHKFGSCHATLCIVICDYNRENKIAVRSSNGDIVAQLYIYNVFLIPLFDPAPFMLFVIVVYLKF